MPDLQNEQNALQHLAESKEWWMVCSCWHIVDLNEGRTETVRQIPDPNCPQCGGTGRVLRYPHLFEAVFEKCPSLPHILGGYTWCICHGTDYVVRPVMEFWYEMFRHHHILIAGGGFQLELEAGIFCGEGLNHRHPVLALIEALEKVLPAAKKVTT